MSKRSRRCGFQPSRLQHLFRPARFLHRGTARSVAAAAGETLNHDFPEYGIAVGLDLMLPNPYCRPAHGTERAHCPPIPLPVSFYLCGPKLPVSCGDGTTAPTAVPKAAIQEDGKAPLKENDIWPSRKTGIVSDNPTSDPGSH